jgi:hypothetical protein
MGDFLEKLILFLYLLGTVQSNLNTDITLITICLVHVCDWTSKLLYACR